MQIIEKELREYVRFVMSEPQYKDHAADWAFGAIDFAVSAHLIDLDVANELYAEYHLID